MHDVFVRICLEGPGSGRVLIVYEYPLLYLLISIPKLLYSASINSCPFVSVLDAHYSVRGTSLEV